MGKTAETVIVRSFAYFSRFPPQFSPCENCAPIVQTTLWNYIRPCSASPYRTSFFTYIMPAPLSTAAETSAILSFAYFSQFPPQFSPCENCALIVQTTLWHFSSLVPPLLTEQVFYLHYARSSIHSCGNFRCSLIRVLLAVSAAVFAAKTAHSLFKQRYGILSPLFRPLLTEQVFYLHYARSSIHSG